MIEFLDSLQDRYFGRSMMSWLRPAVIIFILFASAYLGPKASVRLIALIIVAATMLILMRAPMLGVFLLIGGSMLIPFELGTGTNSSINFSLIMVSVLLGLWILVMLIQQRRIWLYPSRILPPVFGLMIVAVLAFVAGQLPWFTFASQVSISAQLGGLILFILSAGAFLWAGQHITDIKWLQWTVWIFLGLGSVYMLIRLLNLDSTIEIFQGEATGSMFWVWMAALSTSQVLFNSTLSRRNRIFLGLIAAVTVINGVVNRSWASGWLPALVAIIVVIFFLNWKLGLLSIAVCSIMYLFLNPSSAVVDFSNDAYSLFTRQEAWKIVLGEIFKVNPLLGLGPSNYYNYTPLFPILGYNVRFNSHNQYVDILAQTGILGFFMFTWFVFETGRLAFKLINRTKPGFERAYAVGAAGGLVGTLVAGMLGDWIIPFVYNIGLVGFRSSVFAWLFLGGLIAVERSLGKPTKQGEIADERLSVESQ